MITGAIVFICLMTVSWACAMAILVTPPDTRRMNIVMHGSLPFMVLYVLFMTYVLRKNIK